MVLAPTKKWYGDINPDAVDNRGQPVIDGTISSGIVNVFTGRIVANGEWKGFAP
jgi:hypothetical protein